MRRGRGRGGARGAEPRPPRAAPRPRRPPRGAALRPAAGAALGLALLAALDRAAPALPLVGPLHRAGAPFLLASFATLTGLLYCLPESPACRLWNIVVGHVVGAASGLLWVGALGPGPPAACAGLATCVALMLATRSAHPPGFALVLILCQSPGARLLGGLWLLYPGLAGALLLWGVARLLAPRGAGGGGRGGA